MQWLGSVALDGYPSGFSDQEGTIMLTAKSEKEFSAALAEVLSSKSHATTPDMGWPWPWDDSLLTDYAYVFDVEAGEVKAFCFGRPFDLASDEDDSEEPKVVGYFPDMSEVKNVTYGRRSGLIVVSAR